MPKSFAAIAFLFLALTASSHLSALTSDGKISTLSPVQQDIRDRLDHQLGMKFMDEAMLGGANTSALNAGSSDDSLFEKMDGGITLQQNQAELLKRLSPLFGNIDWQTAKSHMARGRNNWIVWTAGNDRFWNYIARTTLGGLDLIKTVSDYDDGKYHLPSVRKNRWEIDGLVNEPCFTESTGRDDRFGLWLPNRTVSKDCPADPFEVEGNYRGVAIGARGQTLTWMDPVTKTNKTTTLPVGSYYGYATGVVGLRLFPNPDFDQVAASKWNPVRFYTDPDYYYDPNLIRPYRVGMACAFCHVGPSPSHPPDDMEHPNWENLSSNVGAQYFWVDRILDWNYTVDKNNFVYQLLHTSRPGSLDTSLVSSDMINNPRTMNAVYNLHSRILAAINLNEMEQLQSPGEQANAQFSQISNKFSPVYDPSLHLASAVTNLSNETGSMHTVLSPRVLKDGSDSVGALGALNRVFINIGLYSEEWTQDFIPLIGGPKFVPYSIPMAQQKSAYWNATVKQTGDLALFFLGSARPDRLQDFPEGKSYLVDQNSDTYKQGQKAFAMHCAECHSSKLPQEAYDIFNDKSNPTKCVGPNYLTCYHEYGQLASTQKYKDELLAMVQAKDAKGRPSFLTDVDNPLNDNFLSTDLRVPATMIDDQLCSPLATNAIAGNTWDNFSSYSYKHLAGIGAFTVNYPDSQGSPNLIAQVIKNVPAGGRGYLRPPSLISLWSTAPFLQNNSVGKFNWGATTKDRLDSFNDSILKMLNPETRGVVTSDNQMVVNYTTNNGYQLQGIMDVTSQASYLKIPARYLPKFLYATLKEIIRKENENEGIAQDGLNQDENIPKMIGTSKLVTMTSPGRSSKGRSVASSTPVGLSKKAERSIASFTSKVSDLFHKWRGDVQQVEANIPKMGSEKDEDPELEDNNVVADYIYVGPIPKGVPVNLISNIDLKNLKFGVDPSVIAGQMRLTDAVIKLIEAVIKVRRDGRAYYQAAYDKDHKTSVRPAQYFETPEARATFLGLVTQPLLAVSKCKDFVVNRGHYFGTKYSPFGAEDALSADDQKALIEYLKYF